MKFKILLTLFLFSLSVLGFSEEALVKLTGKVNTINRIHPVLVSDNKEYLLMLPRFFALKEGEEITVEGYQYDNDRIRMPYYFNNDVDFTLLYVDKLTANGKTYNINDFRNCPGYTNFKERGPLSYHRGRGYMHYNFMY